MTFFNRLYQSCRRLEEWFVYFDLCLLSFVVFRCNLSFAEILKDILWNMVDNFSPPPVVRTLPEFHLPASFLRSLFATKSINPIAFAGISYSKRSKNRLSCARNPFRSFWTEIERNRFSIASKHINLTINILLGSCFAIWTNHFA